MTTFKNTPHRILGSIACLLITAVSVAQYTPLPHRLPGKNEIPVTTPGNYDEPGRTYILVNDITSPKSTVFLGKDVTLDLNGYTLTYADAGYEHIINGSFEEGFKGWDLTKAPSARIVDTRVHVFIGNNMLSLAKGEEITSSYINLPVPGRSYFAMCGIATLDMRVSVFVENEKGESILCITKYADTTMISCPLINRSPRMGGGFVYAHLRALPSGKFRIRVKAETDCLIDYLDIRPAMDAGIGIVGNTHPMGHNDHLYKSDHCAFFDYTSNIDSKTPLPGIPVVRGYGSVVIRNGIIKDATSGIVSWGIQSTADSLNVVLENLNIITSGINSTAVDVPQATITNCKFDVDNPFIINRHGSEFYAVDLRGERPSEVSFSEFHGGQGCLSFKGDNSKIHHNLFVNRQTVTNHYSIMAMGDRSQIFENRIEPEIGSGIEIFRHKGIEIFNNIIRIKASPPTSEYGHEDYSTTAIRIADYGATQGSSDGCFGNKVYNNKFYVTGMDYPQYIDYIPMAWAVFYSASAGDNYIYGNEIEVNNRDRGSKNEASAFYIGGGAVGGEFYNNLITTNVPAAWVATRYGGAKNTRICNNRIIKSDSALKDFKPFRMGWMERDECVAEGISFESNDVSGAPFDVDATAQPHSYSVYWTLTVNVTDYTGKPVDGALIKICDKSGVEIINKRSEKEGLIRVQLPGYSFSSSSKKDNSSYTVKAGNKEEKVILDKNKDVTIALAKGYAISVPAKKYATDFRQNENPVSEGGKWKNGGGNGLDWTNVRTINGIACGTQTGRDSGYFSYNDSYAILSGFLPDQTAEGIVHISNPTKLCNQEVELLLRWNSFPHKATGYECLFRCIDSTGFYMEVVRWNGALGDFTYLDRLHSSSMGIKDGDILKASITGDVIRVYINGVIKLQVSDSVYPEGNPGIGFFLRGCTGTNTDFGFKEFTAKSWH